MSLFSILIALVIETYYQQIEEWRRYDWFGRYHDWMTGKLANMELADGPVGLVINLLGVLFAVWLADAALDGIAGIGALLSFVFSIAVLLYCIGPRDLDSQVKQYIDAVERGDTEAANFYASEIYGRAIVAPPEEVDQITRAAILTAINSRVISVIFWFTLLGPVGAMMYRLSEILKTQYHGNASGFAQSTQRLYDILIWIPARICVFSFALAGNFIDTFSRWQSMGDFIEKDSEQLIIESGLGAIQRDIGQADSDSKSDVQAVLALAKRALIVYIALLAIFTIAGWLA